MRLVIKGAVYFDREGQTVLIPHFTGEFSIVDCTEYITKEELQSKYGSAFIEENADNTIEVEGSTYYFAESSPCAVGDWDLLSDLSELEHTEEEYNF